MIPRFRDKVVAITGAGAGLGRMAALMFAAEGANVAVIDIDERRAAAAAAEVSEAGGSAIPLTCDVTSPADVSAAVAATIARWSRIDVMYANAGIGVRGNGSLPFESLTPEDWDSTFAVNTKGVFLCAREVVTPMRAQGGGVIVVTSSSAGLVAYEGIAPYCASKAAVNGLVRSMALDLGRYNIRANAVCPGVGLAGNSNFLLPPGAPVNKSQDLAGERWNPTERGIPLHTDRPALLEDTVEAAMFLASDQAKYLSGTTLVIDGGQLARVPGMVSKWW